MPSSRPREPRPPAPIVAKLHSTAKAALQSPAVTEQLAAQGAEPIANTPEELRRFLQNEIEVWTKLIKVANIRPNT